MHRYSLLIVGAVVATCAIAAATPIRSEKSERRFQELIAGKVAQKPVSCLPLSRHTNNDMVTIDESTVVFNYNSSKVYVANMQTPCTHIGLGPYALVTRQVGTATICRGDIADVVDTMAHVGAGSCIFGEFTPYVRPGS